MCCWLLAHALHDTILAGPSATANGSRYFVLEKVALSPVSGLVEREGRDGGRDTRSSALGCHSEVEDGQVVWHSNRLHKDREVRAVV